MPFWESVIPALITGGASLLGSRSSASGQSDANVTNISEAQRNRDFQERMSSTAHQREVKDLKAAGLNPVLSAIKGGGASTPSGSTARVESTKKGRGELAQKASSVGVKLYEELMLLKAQRELVKQQGNTARANARIATVHADIDTSPVGKGLIWADKTIKPAAAVAGAAGGVGYMVGK